MSDLHRENSEDATRRQSQLLAPIGRGTSPTFSVGEAAEISGD